MKLHGIALHNFKRDALSGCVDVHNDSVEQDKRTVIPSKVSRFCRKLHLFLCNFWIIDTWSDDLLEAKLVSSFDQRKTARQCSSSARLWGPVKKVCWNEASNSSRMRSSKAQVQDDAFTEDHQDLIGFLLSLISFLNTGLLESMTKTKKDQFGYKLHRNHLALL